MDPIVRQYGFIRCSADNNPDCDFGKDPASACDGTDPQKDPQVNLCAKTPVAATVSAFSAYLPNGAAGGTVGGVGVPLGGTNGQRGGALTINSVGRVWTSTGLVNFVAASGLCVTGKSASGGACQDADPRPLNAACTMDTDCASGRCRDVFGQGVPGAKYNLYCCDPSNAACQ
jgi:hypothetical protein